MTAVSCGVYIATSSMVISKTNRTIGAFEKLLLLLEYWSTLKTSCGQNRTERENIERIACPLIHDDPTTTRAAGFPLKGISQPHPFTTAGFWAFFLVEAGAPPSNLQYRESGL